MASSGKPVGPCVLSSWLGVFSAFGYSVENPLGVKVVWLVCALSCLVGLLVFIPYKLGDTREETRLILDVSLAACQNNRRFDQQRNL